MNSIKTITGLVCVAASVCCTGCWFGSDSDKEKKTNATKQVSPVDIKTEAKNAEALIAWIKIRDKQTELQKKESFGKLKGKMVVFRGEVREVGETTFGGKPFVSLKVGKLSMLENINIQFNVKEAQASTIVAWNKGETHILRGRIKDSGDLQDDASCDNAEVVSDEKYLAAVGKTDGGLNSKASATLGANTTAKPATANLSVGDVNINMEEVRAAIKTWQKDRWNADLIVKAKEANGKVRAADFKVEAKYKDLQPTFDLLVDDYVVYVNILDSFADASSASEAVSQLMKAISFDDAIRMAKDIGKAADGAKSIKENAGWKDVVPIGKDLITISAVSASMTNASGILKSIFDQITKK